LLVKGIGVTQWQKCLLKLVICFKTFLSGKPANTIAPFQVNIIALQ